MANSTSQQEHERNRRRRVRQALGLVLCLLILIGVINVVAACVHGVAALFDDTDKKLAYEQKLQALVMMDPLPFADLSQADPTQLKEYAIWTVVFNAQRTPGGLDTYECDPDTGSAILPAVEVDAALTALLGPDYNSLLDPTGKDESRRITHGSFEAEMNFFYDEEKQGYLVPVTGQMGQYTPQVAKLQKKDGKLRVTVGYIPTPALTGDYSMSSSTTPTKYMDYVFEKVGKEWYLRALEASEMKADTSAAVSQPEYDLDYDYTDPASIIAGNAGGNSDTQPDGAQEPQDDGNSGEGGEGGSSAPEGGSAPQE